MKNKLILGALLLSLAFTPQLQAQSAAFTYQGILTDSGSPATGNYDLRFTIYDDASGGALQGDALTNAATAVSNGLFTVTLDFGNQFPGANRWLAIGVRTNGDSAFDPLSPRQQLTATPYAVQAANAASAVTASSVAAGNITGTINVTQLPTTVITNGASGVNISGSFGGSGAGLTNIPVDAVVGVPISFSFGSDQTVGSGGAFVGVGIQSNTFDDTALPVPFDGLFSTVTFSIRQNVQAGVPTSPTAGQSVEVHLVRVPKTVAQTYGAPAVTLSTVNSAIATYGSTGTPAPDSTIVPQGTTITLVAVLDSTNKHAVASSPLSVPAVAADLFSIMVKPVGFTGFKPALSVVYQNAP